MFSFVIIIAAYLIGAYLIDIGLRGKLTRPPTPPPGSPACTRYWSWKPLLLSVNHQPLMPETLGDTSAADEVLSDQTSSPRSPRSPRF
ncbi:MAG: hypothetical protein R3C45_03680 [Phycisphaerales bacterium]